MKLESSHRFSEKKAEISSSIKIRLVGVELFHADGWTDMTKLIVSFRNFANIPFLVLDDKNVVARQNCTFFSLS